MAVSNPPVPAADRVFSGLPRTEAVTPKKAATVKIWAFFGFLILALQTYVIVKWVTGPNFKRVDGGPTPVPDGIKYASAIVTYGGFPAALWAIWAWVIKPWRETKELTAHALMLIWFGVFGWFYDPVCNYFNAYFTYNSSLPNMGSWVADIPGWTSITAGSPGHMQAYPLLFVITAYVWGLFGLIALTVWFMKWTRKQWPAMSTPALLAVTYAFVAPLFFLLEVIYMRCGIYGYHGAIESLTLWYGKYYQMPIYEPIFSGFYFVGYASLLFFRNDKGETLTERGVTQMRMGKTGKNVVRMCAMGAACALVYMVTYNIPYWFTNQYNAAWPKAAQENSYWTNYICGPETRYACPSHNLPTVTRRSAFFTPEGQLQLRPRNAAPADTEQVLTFKTR